MSQIEHRRAILAVANEGAGSLLERTRQEIRGEREHHHGKDNTAR